MNRQDDPKSNHAPKSKFHESQPSRPHVPEEPYRDENLAALSRVEGGGPIRKVNMDQMPKPLRYFGYAVATILIVGTAILLISDWFS